VKKFLYISFIIVVLIFIIELGYYFYLKNTSKISSFIPLFNFHQRVEVESRLDDIIVSTNKKPLKELLNQFKIWDEGVYIRDFERVLEIKKHPPQKIKIILNYSNYKKDRAFSKGELISSAKEERIGKELVIHLGFSKKFLDSLDNKEKEMYITQSFLTTLYRISHTSQDFKSKEEELKRILIEFLETQRSLFKIK